MGYETTLIFVTNISQNNFKGYCKVEATLEMGKICSGFINDLITKIRKYQTENQKELSEQVTQWKKQWHSCYNQEGNYNKEILKMNDKTEMHNKSKKTHQLEQTIESKLPFIYYQSDNFPNYEDACGDLLMLTDLEKLRTAIIKDNARLITTVTYEKGYNKFNMALKMIDMFRDKLVWGNQEVEVILWGY